MESCYCPETIGVGWPELVGRSRVCQDESGFRLIENHIAFLYSKCTHFREAPAIKNGIFSEAF